MAVFTMKITDNSSKVGAELEEAVKKALTLCGTEAQTYAKKYITQKGAVDTGLLRNSIAYAISGESANPSSYKADKGEKYGSYNGVAPTEKGSKRTVYLGTNVEYAPYIEYGANGRAARPYLEPAIADHADKYKKIIKSTLGG